MRISLNRFAGGKPKCLTLSYDDGVVEDRQLVEIMNRHGIRGTFHLNSASLGRGNRVSADEVAALYRGHEVSAHSASHPFLDHLPVVQIVNELLDDRKALESLVGYPVRGMSYPFGAFSPAVLAVLPQVGIEYARTTASHGGFGLPQDFLTWNPTCHHKANLMDLAAKFLAVQRHQRMNLFYVWGHAYEFPKDDQWGMIEEFCRTVGGKSDVWYATNIEIVDYLNAVKALRFSAAGSIVYNPSAISVWITADGQAVEIPSGQTIKLAP